MDTHTSKLKCRKMLNVHVNAMGCRSGKPKHKKSKLARLNNGVPLDATVHGKPQVQPADDVCAANCDISGSKQRNRKHFRYTTKTPLTLTTTHTAKRHWERPARYYETSVAVGLLCSALLWHCIICVVAAAAVGKTLESAGIIVVVEDDVVDGSQFMINSNGWLLNSSDYAVSMPSGIGVANRNSSSSGGGGDDHNDNGNVPFFGSKALLINDSVDIPHNNSEYIFDRPEIRFLFITAYGIVFCFCIFGNLLVIVVVALSRRLSSITNFFLANLAVADFCVGTFCILQNLSIYLIDSWMFGEFLCRMYQFVHALSYTASIVILMVICMERYFAIVHPITCKQMLTVRRLRRVIITIWLVSAAYSIPKFIFSKTIKNMHIDNGVEEEICILDREMVNSKYLDVLNFLILYLIPLAVMSVFYSKIAVALWRSSHGLQQQQCVDNGSMHRRHHYQHQPQQQQQQQQHHRHHLNRPHQQISPESISPQFTPALSPLPCRSQNPHYGKRGVVISETRVDDDDFEVCLEANRPVVSTCRKTSFNTNTRQANLQTFAESANQSTNSYNYALRARRGVVRMLIAFVLAFAICNLPLHARKMWQYWSHSYHGGTNFTALLTPLTFLCSYINSGLNPVLYAFLSRNFRKGMREVFACAWLPRRTKSTSNSSMQHHYKRKVAQTHSLPTETTHIGNEQL